MRAWYEAGYFEGVSVAASYYGEVPDAYWPIAELWKDPATQAFVLTDGTAAAQVTQEAAPFIPSSEFAGGKLGYVFKTEEWGVGYYEDVSHVDEHGTERWGPKPEVTAASIARHKAEALAKVRNVGYDEDVRA